MSFSGPVLILALLYIWMVSGADGMVGLWTVCVGKPPSDVFLGPTNTHAPAYSGLGFGRGYGKKDKCEAHFHMPGLFNTMFQIDLGNNEFYYLRKLTGGLKDNGAEYVWVDYFDFHYGKKPCTPVKVDEGRKSVSCWLKQAKVTGTSCKKTKYLDILGQCNEESGESFASFCGLGFKYSASFTVRNAQVLCLRNVARRCVNITHAGTVTASGYKKPAMILTDSTYNGGSTEHKWTFEKQYTQETGSEYSTEHGWRLKVSATYSSGLLSDAIAKWEMNVEAEGHGNYVTTRTKKEVKTMKYTGEFVVPKKTKYVVSVKIFILNLDIPYTATEKYFDVEDKFLGEATVRGTWKGVFTFTSNKEIKQTKIEK